MIKYRNLCRLVGFVLLSVIASSGIADTQKPSNVQRLTPIGDAVYEPANLNELVSQAELIIVGRFSNFLGNEKFYGYGNTKESFQEKYALSDLETDRAGLPMSEYTIDVEEVFSGDVKTKTIRYRVLESFPPTGTELDSLNSRKRIFFLNRNPDGESFSIQGSKFMLVEDFGEYRYQVPTLPNTGKSYERTGFFDSASVQDAEATLKALIND